MKRKLGFLMTLVIALCTSSAWAQSVVSVGTNLDFSEGTPVDNGICTYAKDMEGNGTTYSQMLEVAGWAIEGENGDARAAGLFAYGSGHWLGGKGYNVPAANSAGVAEGNALGVVAVWSATAQYTQPVTLEAGNYIINIPVYNSVGGTTAPAKSLIGFIADNGTEYLAPAKAYAVDTWTVETITFTLTEATTGKLSLGYTAPNKGSGDNVHLFFDKVEILYEDLSADDVRGVLNATLASAQATVDAKVGVGAGVFMYSEEAYNTYAAAVAAAKAVSEKAEASVDELKAAVAALNAATAAYTVTAPAADAVYAVKFNGTDNYLTIGESTININTDVDSLSFEAVGNGKYYVHDNKGMYLSYKGSDKWTMVASADVKDEWNISVNAEGLYTFVGKNGGIGVDGTEAGASCYGDKNGAAVALWAIAEIVIEEEPVVDPNDYTSYIVNADLSTTDAWNAEGTKGIKDGMVKVGSQAVYDFSQTITLPAGQYKMTAKAVYRYGSDEQAEYDAIVAGTETHKTKLYAETATYKYEADVQNRYDGASDTDYAGSGTVTINGKYVPNSSAAVQAWFNAGQYVNELVFNVQEDGQIKIGITTVDGIAGDYGNIGAWTLTRLGDAEADPKEEVAPDTIVVNAFLNAYATLEMLTETCPTLWMISSCNEKFMAVQEPAYAMKEAIMSTPVDTLVKYTALITETVEFIQAMDGKYNEWKNQLMVAYDYQDNSTADSIARAEFDALVDVHSGYQWMMPATSVAELEALIAELKDASIAYACVAVANEGFDFGLPTVDSPWVGAAVSDSLYAYVYNASAKAFLGAGNSWGTQASFNDGIEWIVSGADNLYTLDGPISNGGASHFFTGTYTDGAATQVTVKAVGKNLYTLQVGGMYVAYDGTNIVANVAEVSEACYWQFVTKAERQAKYAGASVLNPASATFEISGANFGRNDGRNSAWTGSPKIGGENDNMNGEKWNAGIVEVSQILRGMPNGVYRLSAQGFYRMGGVAGAADARANGTEELHGKFFANGDTIPVMSVMEEAGKVEGVGADYGTFGKAPNSQGEASKFFNAGLYEHSFMFTLAEGVDTIKLGVTKTGSVGDDWLLFDNFRLEFLGQKNDVDYLGNGTLTSVSEGNHYVFYTDAEGKTHFLHAAGTNNWALTESPTTMAFTPGNTSAGDAFAGAASFMVSNGFLMSNAANSDGSGAIKTEAVDGGNGLAAGRTWESQVFYKNAAGKHAIRLTNNNGTGWGANCFVNIDPATLAVVSGQPSLGDALYLWEIADEDDPRFSTQALLTLIEEAEALEGVCSKEAQEALAAAIEVAKAAAASEVQTAKEALEAAIADFKSSVAEYVVLAEVISRAKAVLADNTASEVLAAEVAVAEAAYAEGTAGEATLAELQAALAVYVAAIEEFVVANAIVNGNFASGTTGWTGGMGTGNHNKWTNVNDQFVEKWTAAPGTLADMDFYQEISGLPAGTYTFAAYVNACQQGNDDSYEVTGVKLYANGDSVAVHTINIDRDATNKALGGELVMVTTTIAEGETLKVGMNIASTDANWVVMDNAKLYNFVEAGVVKVESVELDQTAVELVVTTEEAAPSVQLVATVNPEGAAAIAWSTSDAAVATVDANGVVTAVAAGTATITATANGVSATCVVTVSIDNGIENINVLENAVIYTISGKRVQGDVDSLERGIYIVNGKKVFVK